MGAEVEVGVDRKVTLMFKELLPLILLTYMQQSY